MRLIAISSVACALLRCQPVMAADGVVPFTGTITAACVLTVGTPGVLAPNAGYTQLSSKNAGGNAGLVTAITTGSGFSIHASVPSNFTLAPAGSDSTFVTEYSGSGATTIGVTAGGTTTGLSLGTTALSVDLTADKSSGTFESGAYAASVTVTCE